MMGIEIICYLLGVIIGIIIGVIMTRKKHTNEPIGTLRIDSSDPDGPYLFLELSSNVDIVKSKKYVTLKVDTKNYITQK